MITVEEKLNVFSKLVFEKEQHECKKILEELDKKNNELLEKAKKEVEEKRESLIQKHTKLAQREKDQLISEAKVNKRKKILEKKDELLQQLIKEVEQKALLFTETNEYAIYLNNKISEVLSNFNKNEVIVFQLTKKDIERYENNIYRFIEELGYSKNNIKIVSMNEDIIGGVIATKEDLTFRVNCTMKMQILENKHMIGQILYEDLKQAGDYSD